MKVSLNWLKDYVDIGNISIPEIIHKLTMSGLEVEDSIDEAELYKDFIVGYVKDKKKHPNADKLSICTVNTGTEDLQVICGAPNVEAGQKIVFAPIGTIIPNGKFKINKAKIRGVESFGMICSEAELELSNDHSGIMILKQEVNIGKSIVKELGLDDAILEIAITPNRSDALSHIGVARDLASIFDKGFHLPEISIQESTHKVKELASVEIIDKINCPRYSAKVVQNVTIKESPEWLKKRLTKIGLRPINNIVDVTNFVMYELGQPLHAFDLDKLEGQKIVVRSTEAESVFTTLDSKERKLPKGTLMICDGEKPVAIAGVMGGENSEINNSTKNILIESAHFNPSSIRRTSKALGLSTEASYRFERWVDPSATLLAAERAAQLIANLGDGEVAHGALDCYPEKIKEKEVLLRFDRVSKILGYQIPKEKIIQILKKLGLKIVFESEKEYRFLVPTYRPDLEREIDLIEEIARIYGYDNIPTISKISISLGEKIDESAFEDTIRDHSCSLGFYEMVNNPLQKEQFASLTGNKIQILNPQSLDMAFLRTSLIPGALGVIAQNLNVGEKDLRLFEIGNVFNQNFGKEEIKSFDDFTEVQKHIFILTGRINEKMWNTAEKPVDFYDLKGFVNSLIIKISLDNVLNDSYYHNEDSIFDFYFTKNYDKEEVGIGGKVKKEVLKQFDIQQDVYCFELDLTKLKKIKANPKKFVEPLKYPKSIRDFAFIFDNYVTYEEVIKFIKKSSSELLKSVKLFDLFESESLGKNKKSMAFSLEYFSEERTLTEEEIEKDFNNLIEAVTKNFSAILRGA
ncbi:MAG: phenylalanine--tRNA ligase subunit beta [Bacteroidetes bacterium]|nr:phenylalanine--tRNA ligase subunit beta [Bacteroidota bacterium]